MGFLTDKQTLDDLNITGKFKPSSLFSLFNETQTRGGENLLENMFNHPLSDADAINGRSELFNYFHNKNGTFPFNKSLFEKAETYLTAGTGSSLPGLIQKKILQLTVRDEQYEQLQTGLKAAIEVLHTLKDFLQQHPRFNHIKNKIPEIPKTQDLSLMQLARYDRLLRRTHSEDIEAILGFIYHIDVYIAVSNVARNKNFSYAHALPKEQYIFKTTGLYHPALKNAVANSLHLHENENLLFLTGANMAGKSTFMKSLGIALYLAHMGFPVAAKDMQFSIRDGLYTSINVPDNLNLGYSHFYAEVLRVKKVAREVANGNDLLVIFDELFKGTNVKDAFDATLAVTREFATYRNCCFVISTHIIEVGEALKQECDNLQFAYMPTIMEGSIPRYPYTLTTGITNDRHGMLIIENERILELI
jgi:DNA mismatch repair protein MutS